VFDLASPFLQSVFSLFYFFPCGFSLFVLSKTIFQEPEPESSFGELGENCGLAGLYAGEAGE
jgi:hypothetical protein